MIAWTDLHAALAGHALLALYLLVWGVLAVYGAHRFHLVRQFGRRILNEPAPEPPAEWPAVTIQLPIFNERYVVERLIEAAAAVDYPSDRIEIQVLDDSTDETTTLAARKVASLRGHGFDIVHLRRGDRRGYKAGALQFGLERAKGDLLAIFDADFVPAPSLLRSMIPYFVDARVGMVQARWRHLNEEYSLLARLQAISLDGHFVVEHEARQRKECFFNFNGTAGILRKECVVDAGGWQSDTLTEDLDLSYRAQLRGWRFRYAPDVGCPCELPVEMNAFKAQQYRWVKGSIQVARKILPLLWRSALPRRIKIEATFHLTYNVAYVFLLLLSLMLYPVVLARFETRSLLFTLIDFSLFSTATFSLVYYFAVAQRAVRTDWKRRLGYLPLVMSLGIGLAVNNTRAVLEGIFMRGGAFHRTPKFKIERSEDRWRRKRYRVPVSGWTLCEIGLGAYFAWSIIALARAELYASVPFFALYLFGFLYVGVLSLCHGGSRS